MFMKSFAMAAAGLAMVAAPVAASAAPANPASSLSMAKSVRAGTPASKKASKLADGASIVPIIIGVGVLAGVTYLIVDKENDDSDSN